MNIVFKLYLATINTASFLINLSLLYFSFRLLQLFKGGKVAKSWVYLSVGAIFLATGSFVFVVIYLFHVSFIFFQCISGTLMLLGGIFFLLGFYSEYKIWKKKMFSS